MTGNKQYYLDYKCCRLEKSDDENYFLPLDEVRVDMEKFHKQYVGTKPKNPLRRNGDVSKFLGISKDGLGPELGLKTDRESHSENPEKRMGYRGYKLKSIIIPEDVTQITVPLNPFLDPNFKINSTEDNPFKIPTFLSVKKVIPNITDEQYKQLIELFH